MFQFITLQRPTCAVLGVAAWVLAAWAGPAASAPNQPPASAIAATDLDRYVGGYQITRYAGMIVTRQGDGLLLTQQQGPPPELFLQGTGGVWTGTKTGRKFTFDIGPDGQVFALSFTQKPFPGTMKRLPNGEAEKRAAELAAKLKAQVPDSRTEGAIRALVRSVTDGGANFDQLFGERELLAARAQASDMQSDFKSLGDLKTVAFKAVGPQGGDQYVLTFANGQRQINVLLDQQGRIDAMGIQLR